MADKVDFNGLAPSKTIKDDQGKEASMIVSKMANGSKTCMKASCMKGWNWTTGAKPILPGCPDWCPATHFGYLKKGKMEVRMKDEDKWMTFEEGDTYFVPPGHLPRFPEDTEFVEFSQDPVYVKLAEGTQADATPAPAPAPVNLPPGKINYAGMPPTKTMKDGSGKAASMIMGKFANGAKTVNRITIEEGFEWSSGVKPHLPGCPEHCPATHFGFIERGQMEIKMAGSEEWTVFGPGDAYHVPPGHLPRFAKGETVMMEFSNDDTYTHENFLSGLNFFIIEHTFKEGKAEEWWGNMAKMMGDPAAMSAMMTAQHEAGFHNHSFLPGSSLTGTVHCVWEGSAGKSVADMQTFIDAQFGEHMTNTVHGPVDAGTAQLAYSPYFGNNPAAAPSPVKGSTMAVIQHVIKPGQGDTLFANMGKMMADPGAMEGMNAKHKALGFVNHAFFPIKGKTEGLFALCIWECKEGIGMQALQEMIDEHPGVGPYCDNKVFIIDASKGMINLTQQFAPSPEALKGATPAVPVVAPQKSVA
jgi:uncharacterized protein YaiE (UPF0345 family)